jgi:hypothetical protein
MQHGDSRTVSDGGGMNFSEMSAVAFCVYAGVGVSSGSSSVLLWMDSAPPVATPNLAALFPFSVIFQFCCIA